MVGYVDSNCATDLHKHRSTIGQVFTFVIAQVSCKSTLQSTIALSTTKTEYMVVKEDVQEAIWLLVLLEKLGIVQKHANVYSNQSVIHLAKDPIYHVHTKMFDISLCRKLLMKE